jgi:hypothetical protein
MTPFTHQPRSPSPTHTKESRLLPTERPAWRKEQTLVRQNAIHSEWIGYVPEDTSWVAHIIDFLQRGGIDARTGSHKGEEYVQIYGDKNDTDCRGNGMKRLGVYQHSGIYYLTTWGMTTGDIKKGNLFTWVEHLKEVCHGWIDVDSDERPSEWDKRGIRGGYTSKSLIINEMEKEVVCEVIRKLIE